MQNLDQIRAAKANQLCRRNAFTRNDVAGFPAMIINNGLLSACAYALEPGRDSRAGLAHAVHGMAVHMANEALGIAILAGVPNGETLIQKLSERGSSVDLQRATVEALEFFGYLKRFANPSTQ